MLALEGPDGGKGRQWHRLAPADGGVAGDEKVDQGGYAGGAVRRFFGLVQQFVEYGIAALQAGDGQFLLAGEVIGDAGRPEPDQLCHRCQAHTLETMAI